MVSSQTIDGEMVRLSGLRQARPSLEPELEEQFERRTQRMRCRRLWLEGALAIALYFSFAVWDEHLAGAESARAFRLRAGLVMPLAVLVNMGMWLRPGRRVREAAIAGVVTTAGCVELLLAIENGVLLTALMAVVGVLVFANVVMRLSFRTTVALSAMTLLAEAGMLLGSGGLPGEERLRGLVLTSAIGVLTVMANYSSHRTERLNFLQLLQNEGLRKRLEAVNGALAAVNGSLAAAARTDGLTGIGNRGAFEARLADLWSDPRERERALTVVVVDVDHFKTFNDRFGHRYGDRVLQRVARLLHEGLRREEDTVSRYGGEEFMVLLPRTPVDQGLLVAERMREMIALAGLPALETGAAGTLAGARVTISCGVATGVPEQVSAASLVEAADQALYRAKASGRNRVCSAEAVRSAEVLWVAAGEGAVL